MSHQITISDEKYATLATIATEQGKTPEEVLDTILAEIEALTQYAEYDSLFAEAYAAPGFQAGLQRAIEEIAAGQGITFSDTAAFDAALDSVSEEDAPSKAEG
jgi:hypothetical protein